MDIMIWKLCRPFLVGLFVFTLINSIIATASGIDSPKKLTLTAPNFYHKKSFLQTPPAKKIIKAFKQVDIELEVEFFPNLRSLYYSNKGTYDGEFVRAEGISDKYTNLIMVPEPVGIMEYSFYTKSSAGIKHWGELKNSSGGHLLGVFPSFLKLPKGFENTKIYTFKKLQQGINMLLSGRVDFLIVHNYSMQTLQPKTLQSLKKIPFPTTPITLHLYLHKRHHQIIPVLNKVIYEINQDN